MSYVWLYHTHICMHLRICLANIILANWPELLRNCRSQFPHSWVKNCSETGRIRAISMIFGMWFPWANHPKFIHKVIGCHLSTRKFTRDLWRSSKFQVPNEQFFCEVPKRGKGLAVQKPGKSPNRQISNLRHRDGYIKSQKRTFRKIINCQDWGRFVRNPLIRISFGHDIKYQVHFQASWKAAYLLSTGHHYGKTL